MKVWALAVLVHVQSSIAACDNKASEPFVESGACDNVASQVGSKPESALLQVARQNDRSAPQALTETEQKKTWRLAIHDADESLR
jgi:hypothetical protein